jgi:hypothetical protein
MVKGAFGKKLSYLVNFPLTCEAGKDKIFEGVFAEIAPM